MAFYDSTFEKRRQQILGVQSSPQTLGLQTSPTSGFKDPDFEQRRTKIVSQPPRQVSQPAQPVIAQPVQKTSVLQKGSNVAGDIAKGSTKFLARTAVGFADLVTESLDFTSKFVSNNPIFNPGKMIGEAIAKTVTEKVYGKDSKQVQAQKALLNKWKTVETKGIPEIAKAAVDKIQQTEYISPSKEWTSAPLKEKLTKRLGETLAVLGPNIAPSFALYAINPALGLGVTSASTANEVKAGAISNGVSNQKSELLGLGTGILVGALDRIVPDELFNPAQKATFLKSFVKKLVTIPLKEAGTEIAQEDLQIAAEATFRKDLGWDEVKTRNAMAGLGGLLGGSGATVVVGTINNAISQDILLNKDNEEAVEKSKISEIPGLGEDLSFILKGEKKGTPGISVNSIREDSSKIVYRNGSGSPVGAAIIQKMPKWDNPKIIHIYVEPSSRRKGIGTQIYEKAQELGATQVNEQPSPMLQALVDKKDFLKTTRNESVKPRIVTPDEAAAYVAENAKLRGMEEGKKLMLAVMEAKQSGQNIKISPSQDNKNLDIDLVEPNTEEKMGEEKPTVKKEDVETELDLVREAIQSGDKEAAKVLYDEITVEKPEFDKVVSEVESRQNQEQFEAKKERYSQYGDNAEDVKRLVKMYRLLGEKKSQQTGELFREHIPQGKSGEMASDEVATALGITENELMQQVAELAGETIGPKPAKGPELEIVEKGKQKTVTRVISGKEQPVGTEKAKSSRLYKRIKKNLGIEFEEKDVKYNTLNLEEQSGLVTDLLESDPEKAVRIARGLEEPPPGMTQNAAAVGVASLAESQGDFKTAAEMWTKTSLRSTRLGQEIVSLRGDMTTNSVTNAVKRVIFDRVERVAKRYQNIIKALQLPDTYTTVKQVDALVKEQVQRAKKVIQAQQIKIQSAQAIINSIIC